METAEHGLAVIIMAAGKGTRMKSDLAKVLHQLGGKAMIHYVIRTARNLGASPIVVVVGYQKEQVICELSDQPVRFAVQEPQLGTGHAVMCALPHLEDSGGAVLILSGDVPLIKTETLQGFLEHHFKSRAAATVLTARTENPTSYGRIVRQSSGKLAAIVEERDADAATKRINEINSGIYAFQLDALREVLPGLTTKNEQREYYLTDAVRLLAAEGEIVAAFEGNFKEVMGINTGAELEAASQELRLAGNV